MAELALRLLADDLTGALDTAAQFSGTAGPVEVRFRPADARAPEARLAFSTDTRDRDPAEARAVLARLAGFFAGADIAFLKVDSLLRGHPEADLAPVFRNGGFRSAVFAPAFPAQNRITRGGVQLVRGLDGIWRDVRPGFAEALARTGLRVRRIAEPPRLGGSGVFFCDAASDADLTEIVAHAVALAPPLLWCGSAGLARAVASAPVPRTAAPSRPLLAVVGSRHSVTLAQLAALRAVRPDMVVAVRPDEDAHGAVRAALARAGAAVVTFDLGEGVAPPEAARLIAAALASLLPRLERPAGLVVTGGGTLAAVAAALGARGFTVGGEADPGLPCSLVAGGAWDGVRMVSKSGAFGEPDLLVRLVERAGRPLR